MPFEKETLASAVARYGSENVELKAMLTGIEGELGKIVTANCPGDEVLRLYMEVRNFNKKMNKKA